MMYYNIDLDLENPSNDPIFMWSTKSTTHVLTQEELMTIVADDIKMFLKDLVMRCEPIFELGSPKFVVTGEASVIAGLETVIANESNSEVSTYRSTTFGAKEPGLTKQCLVRSTTIKINMFIVK
ncbi:hypothetical protein MGH68_09100 [Erysipelothrix sp. D19-032]